MPILEEYVDAYDKERVRGYDVVDELEKFLGYALSPDIYLPRARILACPVKQNPPNWQHGRVIYSVVSNYLRSLEQTDPVTILDIGTAKGYSALCLFWALKDSGKSGQVYSVDVIDPTVRCLRNTVSELDGLKTLAETLAPFPEAGNVIFEQSTGLQWLANHPERVHVAFVDGKHTGAVVEAEGELLAVRQQPGDVAIFDDVHLRGIYHAMYALKKLYDMEFVTIRPNERAYAIGHRK